MPLYTIATQTGVLSNFAKADLASQLTQMHHTLAGVPENWIHIVFNDYPVGSGFTGGKPAAAAALTLLIRTGRTPEYKRELLAHLWRLLQSATGAPTDQIVIAIQEVSPSQAMEMGEIMPDVPEH
jgi:phenylpyruvate tautomerase PptA (4-oxalocrotonate tautomerase family)